MGLLDTYLSYRKSQQVRAESLRRRLEDRIQKREDFLADPVKVEQHVARRVATLLPAKLAAAKMTQSTLSPAITVDEGFRAGDPLKGLATQVSRLASDPSYVSEFGRSRGYDYNTSGREVVDDIFRTEYSKRAIPAFQYKRKQETGLPFMSNETGQLPGYEDWRKISGEVEIGRDSDGNPVFGGGDSPRKWAGFKHSITPGGIAQSAALGAGFHLAMEGISRLGIRGISKAAGTALASVPAVGPWGLASKVAGAALIAIPEFMMFDAAMDVVKESGWAQARQDEPLKVELASLAAGLALPGAATGTARKIQGRVRAATALRAEEVKRGMDIVKRWTTMGYEGDGNTALSILRQEAAKSQRLRVAKDVGSLESGFSAALKKDPEVFHRVLERLETDIGRVKTLGTPATTPVETIFGTPQISEGLDLSVTAAMAPEERLLANRVGLDLFGDAESIRKNSKKLLRSIRKGGEEAVSVDTKYVNDTYRYALRNLDEEGAEHVMDYMSSGLPKEHAVMKAYRMQQDVQNLIRMTSDEVLNRAAADLAPLDKAWQDGINRLGTALRGKGTVGMPVPEPSVKWGRHNYKYMPVGNDLDFDVYTRLANQSYHSKAGRARALFRHGKISKVQMYRDIINADREQWTDIISKWNELESARGYSTIFKKMNYGTVEAQMKDLFPKRFTETTVGSRIIRTVENELIQQAKMKIPNDALDMLQSGKEEEFVGVWRNYIAARKGKPVKATEQQIKALKKEQELLNKKGAMKGEAAPDIKFVDVSESLKDSEDVDNFLSAITQHRKYILALATIPMAAFMANDADAAPAPVEVAKAGGRIGALAAKEWLGAFKYGTKSQESLMKDLIKNKFVSIFGSNKYLPKQDMEGVSQMALRKHWKLGQGEIIKNYKGVGPLQTWVMSKPALAGLIYHKWFNPWVEMASKITASFENTSMDMLAANNILGEVRTLTNKSHRDISKTMKPFADKYYKAAVDADVLKRVVDQIDEDMKPILARQKAGKLTDGDLESLAAFKQSRAKNQELYDAAHANFKSLGAEWETTVKPLARRYAETRIFLALDDTADFKKYPWLKGMLSREELAAVSRFRDLFARKGAMIQQTGEKIISGPYVHYAHHPAIDFSTIREQYRNVLKGELETVKFAHFHNRSLGAKPTMPDIRYSVEQYFPDANRRIQISKFWNSGWRDHMKWAVNQSNGLRDFWDDFNKSFRPIEDTKINRLFRNYYSFEVGRLLFLSPSVAHKHFLKQTGNIAMFGAGPVMRNINKSFQSEMFSRLSKPQYRDVTLDTGKRLTAYERSSFIKAMSNQGTFNNVINDLDIGDVPRNKLMSALAQWNEKGAVMVDFIEKFDRGNSILMALEMAGKKGMTPEQAAYSVYDTIIKANFLSGVTNPTWLRNPKIRAFAMFQGTPFKLMEQRVLRAIGGVKAGSNVAKRLWKQVDDMGAIKEQMKGFENEFKAHLVMDAFNADTDIFGTNIGKQFMNNVIALGAVAFTYGQVTDGNLWPQLFHPPFIKPGPHQIGIGLSPAVSAVWKATHDKSEDNWYLNTALRQYLANGRNVGVTDVLPVNLRKGFRILQEDYPQLYGDDNKSWYKYLFGIPSKGQGHLY